ncbi:MAG: L-seryl-tRNA(Sec) selenium transferase, partial [Clostridium sp.]|nr:L-seryl-tRNA(Sec) selenium transferase [Clostridium sp.]
MDKGALYRSIPKVDILLEKQEIKEASEKYGHGIVMDAIREQTDALRKKIGELADGSAEEKSTGKAADAGVAGKAEEALKAAVESLVPDICARVKALHTPKVRKVINGTGTILHTNLGRAPISRSQAEKLIDIVTGYSNLEYDLEKGARGERYSHFEALLCRLTGAEAAMVVNNNAAAVMLILSTMAKGGEVVVSRGELVEIGGKFR